MLEKWQDMLQELKKESRKPAILGRMENTLEESRKEVSQCYKPY